MTLDSFEAAAINIEHNAYTNRLAVINNGFETSVKPVKGYYQQIDPAIDTNISRILGIDDVNLIAEVRPTIIDSTRQLLHGLDLNGFHTLGLEEISSWKINPDYKIQNLKQQSGYAAEVVSTWKENLISQAKGADIRTVRADDLPDLFSRNDQYVDKVRMTPDGQIIDRIQTKFVGSNGGEWLSKVMSKDFDKYFDGNVDKLECPKNFYDDVMSRIPQKREALQRQLNRVTADGKIEVAQKLQRNIDKLNQLETMVEKSTVSTDEAMYARLHPKAYAAKMFATEVAKTSNVEGLKSGALAAGITCVVSTVDNISSCINGEISAEEMAMGIIEDTAVAAALGYGTAFVSTAAAQALSASSSALIRSVGGSCLPAAVVSFAVDSYDSLSNYAQGEIDGAELAYELGESAASVAGAFAGGALAGAAVGAVAGPAGAVAGSIVGGVVGCVVATEVYATAIELGAEGAEHIAEQAEKLAQGTLDLVEEYIPEKLDDVRNAFSDFIDSAKLPFSL